jgi:hypothetical protein
MFKKSIIVLYHFVHIKKICISLMFTDFSFKFISSLYFLSGYFEQNINAQYRTTQHHVNGSSCKYEYKNAFTCQMNADILQCLLCPYTFNLSVCHTHMHTRAHACERKCFVCVCVRARACMRTCMYEREIYV